MSNILDFKHEITKEHDIAMEHGFSEFKMEEDEDPTKKLAYYCFYIRLLRAQQFRLIADIYDAVPKHHGEPFVFISDRFGSEQLCVGGRFQNDDHHME